ncbi:MAG: cytochrome C [Sulfurimonadaceae bacterium]|jgi:cytochrome c-type protein NapB|nr:cytochrome C [Sulfurimonadaceae bacterium]
MKKIVTASIVALATASALMAAPVNPAKCASCHGADWTKVHMGNKNVSEMSHADIATALKGYKDGSYGAAKKALMKGQVASHSNEELEAFAQTIGK